jgi:hypothetical protein
VAHDVTFACDRLQCELEILSARYQCGERYLLAGIDKDLPTIDTLQFQNPALEPGIVLQIFANFIFVVGIDDEKGAMRQPSFVDQRSAHENETVVDKIVDESRVFIPERLLTRALQWIAIGANRRNYNELILHHEIRLDLSTD